MIVHDHISNLIEYFENRKREYQNATYATEEDMRNCFKIDRRIDFLKAEKRSNEFLSLKDLDVDVDEKAIIYIEELKLRFRNQFEEQICD